jgi:2-oxoglutarate ferredoxin oxidoreductase subunit beta
MILEGCRRLKAVNLGENGITEKNILVHDAYEPNPGIQYMLANMRYPEYPVALGVIRSVDGSTYETDVREQIEGIQKTAKIKCVDDLLKSGSTWSVG